MTEMNRLQAKIKCKIKSLKKNQKDYIQSLALRRVRKPFVRNTPQSVQNGFVCTDSEKTEAFAEQYEIQFPPHPENRVFDPETIYKVYNIIEIFSN